MTGHCFDDFVVGERFETRGVTLTESGIIDFAHLDAFAQAAAESPFSAMPP